MYKKIFLFVFALCLMPSVVFAIDSDQDGLSDTAEAYYMTDPYNIDTDGDGFSDYVEVTHDYSPHVGGGVRLNEYDYDKDGLNDWLERWFGSEIGVVDSDGDGFNDFKEVMHGYSPKSIMNQKLFHQEIVVDRTQQRLYYYVDNVKIVSLPVSTGNPNTPTPEGEFKIQRMVDIKPYIGADYYLPNVKWNMQFIPLYYIHGTYWHNDFGIKTHSHGCVNLSEEDAELLYEFATVGMSVQVIGETPQNYWVGT